MKHLFKAGAALLALTGIYMLSTAEKEPLSDSIQDNDNKVWLAPMLYNGSDSDVMSQTIDTAAGPLDFAREMDLFASQYLGRRYRLGATGPSAFDCSGFTSHIFKNFGMNLNRTSRAQYTQGEKVDVKDVKPGDLLFFSGRKAGKKVGHVAMVTSVDPSTGQMEFIHASSSKGITYQKFPDNGYFSRRFLGARRIIGTDGFSPTLPKA